MTSKKKRLGNNLSSLLEMDNLSLSLEKLVGSPLAIPNSQSKPLELTAEISLDSIAKDLGVTSPEDSMEDFINKYSSPTYDSLDALLLSSTSAANLTSSYTPSKSTDKKNLFEGLDDLFD